MKNEVNSWSVTWGVLMAILFSAAAAYLGLKVGQVFEAAIPIAIIAVGVSTAAKRSNALRENVIIQSIGACSGAVVAGAIFTLPAIYILQAKYPEMSADFLKIFIASLLGGVLGILFLIPFRRYFVEAPQEQFPFPEATATTQVLKSGDKGSSQAKPLLIAGLVGGLYDFIVATFGWWNENVTSRMIPFGDDLAEKTKLVFKNNTGAAVLGLRYIIGFRYALIITLGSLFVWWLVVPGMALLFPDTVLNQWNPAIDTRHWSHRYGWYHRHHQVVGCYQECRWIGNESGFCNRIAEHCTTRPAFQVHSHCSHADAYPHLPLLLVWCHGRQSALCPCSHYPHGCHCIPFHHRCSQCHCYCGLQPC